MNSQQAVELLKQMIAIPSHSRDEKGVADMLQNYVEQLGYKVNRCVHNLWIQSSFWSNEKPTLLLDGHIDTVKPADGWLTDPYTPVEQDGKMIGLGSNDTGGSVVSLLATFLELDKKEQPYNIIWLASTEEEVGEILDSLFGNIVYEDESEEEEPAIDELDELTKMALDALAFAKDIEDEPAEDALGEMTFEIEEPAFPDEPAEADAAEEIPENAEETAEPVIEEIAEPSTEEVAEPAAVYDDAPYIDEERIRNEIEAKIRLEYESRARIRAEEEVAKLRREQERLRVENEALLAEAQKEKEAIRLEYERLKEQTERNEAAVKARDAVRRAEEEKLRNEIEARLRHEARERERLAEAARMAIEEQRRLEAEAARAQRIVEEEERARRIAE